MKKEKLKNQSGFTMPEVLISVGLFLVIIAVTSAAFLIGLKGQRQIIAMINANENISYALETMARDIRMGSTFFAPLEEEINFLNYENEAVVYRLNNETIEKSIGGREFEPLTSTNIRITKLSFKIDGDKRFDDKQTKITVLMRINSRFGNRESTNDIQTSISPRELENYAK